MYLIRSDLIEKYADRIKSTKNKFQTLDITPKHVIVGMIQKINAFVKSNIQKQIKPWELNFKNE